jgi:hypothetical protein
MLFSDTEPPKNLSVALQCSKGHYTSPEGCIFELWFLTPRTTKKAPGKASGAFDRHDRLGPILGETLNRMRLAICFSMALIVLYPVTTSADTVYQGPGISGGAIRALVRAFDVAGLPGTMAPPFRLRPYVVMIHAGVGFFLVDFLSEATSAHQGVAVSATTGEVISKPQDWADNSVEGIVLPGIVAGEIISVFEQARRDKVVPLESETLDVHFEVDQGPHLRFQSRCRPRNRIVWAVVLP